MKSHNYIFCVTVFACLATIAGCKQKEDDYVYEQAYLSAGRGIDTIEVNSPSCVTLRATMPNCCGAEFLMIEINSSAVSRTIKAEGRYKGDYPYETAPESKEIQYTFTPSRKGNFFLYCAQRDGSYTADTLWVR